MVNAGHSIDLAIPFTMNDRSMEFISGKEIYASFPGMKIVVVFVPEINNSIDIPEVKEFWQAKWRQAGIEGLHYANAQSHPRIRPWRNYFKQMGFSGKKFPCSAEALLRRALKTDEPFYINPLVDFYNAISMQYMVPAGAFDLGKMNGPLEARLTREGDSFTSLDSPESLAVPAGETAYACGSNILSRHLVWRQSRLGLVRPETKTAVVLSEIPDIGDEQLAQTVKDAIVQGLEHFFKAPSRGFVAGAGSSDFASH